jgi:hypothetical protein
MAEFAYIPFLVEAGAPRLTPFDPRGQGMYFVYLSNRNHCTYLFDAAPLDEEFVSALNTQFEMGYSTLFILEPWWSWQPGKPVCASADLPPRVAFLEGYAFCVFRDPGRTCVGQAAVTSEHADVHEAIAAATAFAQEHEIAVAAARIVDRLSWH